MEDFRTAIDMGLNPELLRSVTNAAISKYSDPKRASSELESLLEKQQTPVQLEMPWPEFGGGNVDG